MKTLLVVLGLLITQACLTKKETQEADTKTFPASYLIGYGLASDDPTDKEEEDFIKKRIDQFFDKKNFFQPAISKDDTFEDDYSDRAIWNDIKSDQTAVGFSYLIGEEDGRLIAFSKKAGKVVLYFNCC